MTEMRRFGLLDFLLLFLVFLLAGGARAGYLTSCAHDGEFPGLFQVQENSTIDGNDAVQQQLIENVQKEFWFGSEAPFSDGQEPTAHVAPGYPYLVGVLGKYLPNQNVNKLVRWGQVGLGAFTAAFYFLFARRAFRSLMAGLIAGLFTAFHPFWVVEVANLNDATLACAALAAALFLAGRAGDSGGALTSLLLGAALAGAALVRAAFLPFSFVILIWFLLRSRTLRYGWLCALCAFLGFGAAISPWTIRNYQDFNEPVPVVSSTYLHLWIGNNPKATGGPATQEMLNEAPVEELKQIKEQPARYARLGKLVQEEIAKNPVKTVERRIQAILYFFFGQRWFIDQTLVVKQSENPDVPPWITDNYVLIFHSVFLGMLLLTFLGWRWSYGWRWESIPAALAMMWIPLPYVLGHAGTLSGDRLPLDGVMLTFSAFALCCFIPGVGGHLLGGAENATSQTTEAEPGQQQQQQSL